MSIYGLFRGRGPNGFGYNSLAQEVSEGIDLFGQTFLVTGSNSGLGLETVRVLLARGAKVIAAARTAEKAAAATRGMDGTIIPLACELSDPDSVRAAVRAVRDDGHVLAGIIANAGIMALPERQVAPGPTATSRNRAHSGATRPWPRNYGRQPRKSSPSSELGARPQSYRRAAPSPRLPRCARALTALRLIPSSVAASSGDRPPHRVSNKASRCVRGSTASA